ncbi:unnamed protein product [Durusdinium trenchii]|uniref:Uncharacterized protein n=2 Tax=Durusdinium trenchii TaxID=1381693 RepID=A0ABP0LVW9_9DINO
MAGHPRCGPEFWHEDRAAWRRIPEDIEVQETPRPPPPDDDATPSLPLEGHGQTEELTPADRMNLRSCLAATAGPYPPLRRRFPLRVVIQAAVQIWEVESPLLSEQGSPITRMANAARESTQDFLVRTAAAGSSFVSWGQGLLGSAAKAFDQHCRPMSSVRERKDKTLVDSLRNRGGIVMEPGDETRAVTTL